MRGRKEGGVGLCEAFAKTKDNIEVWLVRTLCSMVARMVLTSASACDTPFKPKICFVASFKITPEGSSSSMPQTQPSASAHSY